MSETIPCLTIWQPWASAIIYGGDGIFKDVENRTWETPYRGDLLIHASKRWDSYFDDDVMDLNGIFIRRQDCVFGAILGIVTLTDCTREIQSDWHYEPNIGWYLKDPLPLARPVPYRGQQGLFRVPKDVIKAEVAETEA